MVLLLFSDLQSSKVASNSIIEGSVIEVIVQNIDRSGKIKLAPNPILNMIFINV